MLNGSIIREICVICGDYFHLALLYAYRHNSAMSAASSTAILDQLPPKEYKARARAWMMYDWANSAFSTTIMAALLPVYYSAVAGSTLASEAQATQYWATGLSISVFIIAILSPILGTISDIKRGKKKFLSLFIALGVIGTGLLVLVDTGDWFMASMFFIVARVGNGAANVFYDSLLPHVAKEEDQDDISSKGYALGYLGGGLLLAINVVMFLMLPGNWGVRLSFLSVAVWWAVFSIPILRRVPEPESATKRLAPGERLIVVSFARLRKTFSEIREYKELFKYLIAFLIYNDGIGTIIGIAAIYGAELGFGTLELVLALLLVQFVGIPFSIIFGKLPDPTNKWRPVFLAFILFNIVMLPLMGIGGRFLLDQDITGIPSAAFESTETAVGEGAYPADDSALVYNGEWQTTTITGAERGTDNDAVYAMSDDAAGRTDFAFNGQKLTLTYQTGPEMGIWEVWLDGEPLLDDEGQPILLDAFNPTVRYDVTEDFIAATEGEHIFSLVNTGVQNPESSGNHMAVSQFVVQPPLRTSSLPVIIGLLLALQVVGVIFALLLGRPLFKGLAATLTTKRAIMISLAAYTIIAIWGFILNSVVEFWFLAWLVAIVQGGSQALSRSLYASLSPPSMSGEFFGLFSIMSKFASFVSPIFFIGAIAIFGSSRPGVLSIVIFFVIGGYLLSRVKVPEGIQMAREKEAEMLKARDA